MPSMRKLCLASRWAQPWSLVVLGMTACGGGGGTIVLQYARSTQPAGTRRHDGRQRTRRSSWALTYPAEREPGRRLCAYRLRHEGVLRLHQRPGRRLRAQDQLHHRRRPLQSGGHGGGDEEAGGAGQGVRDHRRPRRRNARSPSTSTSKRRACRTCISRPASTSGPNPVVKNRFGGNPDYVTEGKFLGAVHRQELPRQEARLPPPERRVGRGRREGSEARSWRAATCRSSPWRSTRRSSPTSPPRRSG